MDRQVVGTLVSGSAESSDLEIKNNCLTETLDAASISYYTMAQVNT